MKFKITVTWKRSDKAPVRIHTQYGEGTFDDAIRLIKSTSINLFCDHGTDTVIAGFSVGYDY